MRDKKTLSIGVIAMYGEYSQNFAKIRSISELGEQYRD